MQWPSGHPGKPKLLESRVLLVDYPPHIQHMQHCICHPTDHPTRMMIIIREVLIWIVFFYKGLVAWCHSFWFICILSIETYSTVYNIIHKRWGPLQYLHCCCSEEGSIRLSQILEILQYVQKPNSWKCNLFDSSEHNLESAQTWGFLMLCFPLQTSFQPLSLGGGGVLRGWEYSKNG